MDSETKAYKAIAMVLLIPVMIAFDGFVVWKLWTWFCVPLGAPQINLAHCLGITLLIQRMRPVNNRFDNESKWAAVSFLFLNPIFALVVGYILRMFV